jgi:hypothetical protein
MLRPRHLARSAFASLLAVGIQAPTTCPLGCCDSNGQCVPNGLGAQTACGVCGASCVDCTLGGSYPGLFCQNGQCDQPHA